MWTEPQWDWPHCVAESTAVISARAMFCCIPTNGPQEMVPRPGCMTAHAARESSSSVGFEQLPSVKQWTTPASGGNSNWFTRFSSASNASYTRVLHGFEGTRPWSTNESGRWGHWDTNVENLCRSPSNLLQFRYLCSKVSGTPHFQQCDGLRLSNLCLSAFETKAPSRAMLTHSSSCTVSVWSQNVVRLTSHPSKSV